jgi:hypothetical protein
MSLSVPDAARANQQIALTAHAMKNPPLALSRRCHIDGVQAGAVMMDLPVGCRC